MTTNFLGFSKKRTLGGPLPAPRKHLTLAERISVFSLIHERGRTPQQVADLFGVNVATVNRIANLAISEIEEVAHQVRPIAGASS